jgi:hypothetical protein
MPLSPLVSADVPAVSIAVQHLLSGPAQPFSFLNFHQGELVQELKTVEGTTCGLVRAAGHHSLHQRTQ